MILKDSHSNVFDQLPTEVNLEIEVKRKELPYSYLSDVFKCTSKDFTKQFAHIYAVRLNILRDRLLKIAQSKWGNIKICTLAELGDEEHRECIISGTLYKHQPLKPSVLKEISEEHQLVPQPPATHYTSAEDILILEDETQRVRLSGNLPIATMVTGIVIAVKGKEGEDGRFYVEDFCFAGVETPSAGIDTLSDDCYVALLSGLEFMSNHDMLSLQLMADWLCGDSGGDADQSQASTIVRIIMAGGLLANGEDTDNEKALVDAAKQLDLFCLRLAGSIPLDIMPGDSDPSNHSLPQQPIHPCIFQQTARLKSCQLASNPHKCSIGGRQILGHSGQPLESLTRVTDDCQPIQLLEDTLKWGHISPTAPDTLACYPYYDKDPFIIEEQPDIYFAGNQKTFQTTLFTSKSGTDRPCRLVCIPSFSTSRTVILVNLRTLDCTPLTFQSL